MLLADALDRRQRERRRAHVGSESLRCTSLAKNREVGVIAVEESSIAPMIETFDKDRAADLAFE